MEDINDFDIHNCLVIASGDFNNYKEITLVNQQFCMLTNLELDDIMHKSVDIIFPDHISHIHDKILSNLINGKTHLND